MQPRLQCGAVFRCAAPSTRLLRWRITRWVPRSSMEPWSLFLFFRARFAIVSQYSVPLTLALSRRRRRPKGFAAHATADGADGRLERVVGRPIAHVPCNPVIQGVDDAEPTVI